MSNDLEAARKELDNEYRQFRENLGEILEKVERVNAAGPEDYICALLEELEHTTKQVRTGGFVGSGAKGHREAREKYLAAKAKPD